jgi:hypothetical protein
MISFNDGSVARWKQNISLPNLCGNVAPPNLFAVFSQPQFQHPSSFVLELAEHDPLSHQQVAVSRFLSP